MGRKIPGKKHKGVKDPEKQRQKRENQLKTKINNPPPDPCEQEISRTLRKIMDYKKRQMEQYCKPVSKEAKKPKSPVLTDKMKKKLRRAQQPSREAPSFIPYPGETNREFKNRMHCVTRDFLNEVKIETKYNVRIKKNPLTGDVECFEPVTDPLEVCKKRKRPVPKKKKVKKVEVDVALPTQGPIFEKPFLSSMPPRLCQPRCIPAPICAPRPGSRDLLLKEKLENRPSNIVMDKVSSKITVYRRVVGSETETKINKNVNTKGKRKDLPVAVRKRLEQQQKAVVNAYKAFKAQKNVSR